MNKFLNPYVNEIIAIAGKNNVSADVGPNMFLQNVLNAGVDGAPYYEGADDIDFAKLKSELGTLSDVDRQDILQTYDECYDAHKDEVIALRKEGKYAEAAMVMVRA